MEAREAEGAFVVVASPDLVVGVSGEVGAIGAEVEGRIGVRAGDGDVAGDETAARSWRHWRLLAWSG